MGLLNKTPFSELMKMEGEIVCFTDEYKCIALHKGRPRGPFFEIRSKSGKFLSAGTQSTNPDAWRMAHWHNVS